MKAFADDNVSVAKMVHFFSNRVENIVGKREIASFQHSFFPQNPHPQFFSQAYFLRVCLIVL